MGSWGESQVLGNTWVVSPAAVGRCFSFLHHSQNAYFFSLAAVSHPVVSQTTRWHLLLLSDLRSPPEGPPCACTAIFLQDV